MISILTCSGLIFSIHLRTIILDNLIIIDSDVVCYIPQLGNSRHRVSVRPILFSDLENKDEPSEPSIGNRNANHEIVPVEISSNEYLLLFGIQYVDE